MNQETAKAINDISKRLFNIEQKLESFLLGKHKENKDRIETSDGGIIDIADTVSLHDEILCELAKTISNIVEGGTSNG